MCGVAGFSQSMKVLSVLVVLVMAGPILLVMTAEETGAVADTLASRSPTFAAPASSSTAFVHPAGWHTTGDIARMRSLSNREPWATALKNLLNTSGLTPAYRGRPQRIVHRDCCNPHPNSSGDRELETDAIAAYYLALRWAATGNLTHAVVARDIIDAWSGTIEGFAGHDQMLAAGIYGSHLAQAAELVGAALPTPTAWPLRARAESMFLNVFHPVCVYFCGRSSTGLPMPPPQSCDHGPNGNWDTSCMSGVASWAVFLDNASMLETVSTYYKAGRGNGRLTNYIINTAGQCQESGRDQGHTQDGIEHLLEVALTLWHATNSTEPFTEANCRLRAGVEYTARYNLGHTVPFTPNCGAYPHSGWCFKSISNKSRGDFSATWELASAIYGQEDAPWSHAVVGQNGYRPEGRRPPIIYNGPHVGDGPPGQGTLTFYGMPSPLKEGTCGPPPLPPLPSTPVISSHQQHQVP